MTLKTRAVLNSDADTNLADNSSQAITEGVVRATVKNLADSALIQEPWANLASASTTDLGAQSSSYINVTGTTGITSFGTVAAGVTKFLKFAGALAITLGANILGTVPAATAAGDTALVISEGSGVWRVIDYTKANGKSTIFAASADITDSTTFGRSLLTAANQAAAQSALAIGTAGLKDTGTSGATVPLLNGVNTWASAQTFTVAPVFTAQSSTRTALGLVAIASSGSASDLTTGTVPDAVLSGTYSGFSLKLSATNTVFGVAPSAANGRTVYDLVQYRGGAATGAIVFSAPSSVAGCMHQIVVRGRLHNPAAVIDFIVGGYKATATGAWSFTGISHRGDNHPMVRWADDASGNHCLIIGDVGTVWSFPHFAAVMASFSHTGASDAYCQNWTSALVTDLSAFTNITSDLTLTETGGALFYASLNALSSVTPAADTIGYFTSASAAASTAFTSAARTFLAATSATNQRSALGLVLGTNVQAWNPNLEGISGLSFGLGNYVALTAGAAGTWSALQVGATGQSLIGAANQAAAQSTLGLGTAALKDTGTSGNTVPLLDGANTFSGANIFNGTTVGYSLTLSTTAAASSTVGPNLTLYRNSTQSASNQLGIINWQANSSAGTLRNFARVFARTITAVDGSEDGELRFQTIQGGTVTNVLFLGGGLYTSSQSDNGLNTISAATFYESGTSLAGTYASLDLYRRLTADTAGTNGSAAQQWFPTTGAVTLPGSTLYEFEGQLFLSRTAGTTSHTISLLFGGTATLTDIGYSIIVSTAATNVLAADQNIQAAAATAVVITAANTSANEFVAVLVKGMVSINAGGTFIPQFKYSAAPGGAPTILKNSFFKLTKLGTNTQASFGSWA